jgi:aminopeptidase N
MAGANRSLTARLAAMFTFFSTTMGEAPYPDFTLAAIDDTLPGGHSPAFFALLHQPLPTQGITWAGDPVSFETTYQHFFLAHEVAHQWWGQAIGWKNYHEQWLSEGLSQYFALLFAADDRGPDTLRSLLGQMRGSALNLSRNGPIYLGYRLGHIQGDGRIFRGLVYNKSAVVLHMLRGLVGDQAFFDGLRRFYTEFRFRKTGTDDLQRALEAASGQRLDRFFERWVFSAGIPRVRATARAGADGVMVLRVEQVGDDVYDLPVTFAVQYADGTAEDLVVSSTAALVERRLDGAKPIRRVGVREELTLAEFVR